MGKVKPFRDWSIRHKLTGLFMTMACITAVTVFLLVGAFDLIGLKQSMAQDLSTLADVLAQNSTAALTFRDVDAARDVLQALKAQSGVTQACIYTNDGTPFVKYVRQGKESDFLPPPAQIREASIQSGRLIVSRRILFGEEAVGTIYLASDLQRFYGRLREYSLVFLATAVVALLLALMISPRLQRPISRPLTELVQTTKAIASAADYSIRARLLNRDEFGTLVSAFNGMLEKIEITNCQLRQHREQLEEQVAFRTSELVAASAELRESENKYRVLFEDSADAFWLMDTQGFVDCNPAALQLFGYSAKAEFKHPADISPLHQPDGRSSRIAAEERMAAAFLKGKERFEWLLRRKNGEVFHADVCLAAMTLQGHRMLLATVRDITERKIAEERVQFLAYYDGLTGLPNRTLLEDRISNALADARRRNENAAVLFLDLDRFKFINDTLGHTSGDVLLQEVAARLKGWAREQDTVARVGGDEFVVLLTSVAQASDAAMAAQRILDAITAEFPVHGNLLKVTCSVGISMFPEHGGDCETLVKNADAAMYYAKQKGPNNIQFFTADLNDQISERLKMENGLRLALDREELFLVYQPQMDISTGEIVGVEALLRWQHPELGLVSPDRFIRIAENTGLIVPIGEWVLRTACTQARKWQDEGLRLVQIAVNVSAVQFRQDGFRDLIGSVLHETGLAPQYLELELTESLLLTNADVMFSVLKDLKEMGLKLAIDDFGTGYSSLSYLKQFPVSKLKIDRSFVRDIAINPDDAAITAAIIGMAKNLNLKVIAEGVENEAQLSFLRAHQCDEIQGYYFSRPLLADKVADMLRGHKIELALPPKRAETIYLGRDSKFPASVIDRIASGVVTKAS
jgi:diguanylate cyclase (GGDEF)-like protein/PAS domain S-box-containing protein